MMISESRIVLVMLVLGLLSSTGTGEDLDGTFLMIWPTPRSTALAGAMTGLADEADASYWNPGGLCFRTGYSGILTHNYFLPGLFEGMYYENASIGAGFPGLLGKGKNLGVGMNATYLDLGKYDRSDANGNYLGTATDWRGAAELQGGFSFSEHLGIGLGLKVIHTPVEEPDWFGMGSPLTETGTSVAADLGVLCRPVSTLSIGLAAVNLGPNIGYRDQYFDGHALPRSVRFGVCFTPVATRTIQTKVMLETDKLLVSEDSTLGDWLNHTSRSLACELTAFEILSLRLGYYEYPEWATGGIVIDREHGLTEHVGLIDALFSKQPGNFHSLGLCYGLGLGYRNLLRFDVSSDAMIYDFATSNWKFALVTNDAIGLFRAVLRRT
jgi:hypothetical protein